MGKRRTRRTWLLLPKRRTSIQRRLPESELSELSKSNTAKVSDTG